MADTKVRPHGSYGKYKTEKCRCSDCRRANRDSNRRWVRTKAKAAYGMAEPLWVDAEPVRSHVRSLMAAGMGVPRIQQASGVTKGMLTRLVYGNPGRGEAPSLKIRPVNAAKLLAVRAPQLADSALVDATGTRRRLQALVAVGWSGAELMRRIGVIGSDFPKLIGRDQVLARTERAVRALYEQLWNTAPPASTRWERATRSRALAFAAAHNWLPPQAWDDDQIDDPNYQPELTGTGGVDEVAVERCLAGRLDASELNPAERVRLAEVLRKRGQGVSALQRLLRCNGSTARKIMAEAS